MTSTWVRQRVPIAIAIAVIATVISLVSATRTSDGVAVSIALDLAIACVAALTQSGFKSSHPVVTRAALTLLGLDVAIFITFWLPSSANFNLATGAAMSIVLLGLSFLTGASGQISLGNGAFMGVGAFVMAIWANHHATTPIVVTLLIAVVCGALVGLLLGLPATRLRGPYLAGMTLAFAVAFIFILSSFSSWTGGDSGLQLPTAATAPRWLDGLFHAGTSPLTTTTLYLTDFAILVAGVAFFFMANLFASRTGRSMRLIRDNDVAAELVGISLPRARVIAFIVSSAYAALGRRPLHADQQRGVAVDLLIRAVGHNPVAHRDRWHRHDLRRPHRRRHLRLLDERHLLDHVTDRPQPSREFRQPTQWHHLRWTLDLDDALRALWHRGRRTTCCGIVCVHDVRGDLQRPRVTPTLTQQEFYIRGDRQNAEIQVTSRDGYGHGAFAVSGPRHRGGSIVSASAATKKVPGVTAKQITIGATEPLTGIASAGYDQIAPAMSAVFKWVNAHGGVNGRKIKFVVKDDCYGTPGSGCTSTNPSTVAQTHALLGLPVFATVGSLGTPTQDSVRALLRGDDVPQTFVASGSQDWNNP